MKVRTFFVENSGTGKLMYEKQDAPFDGCRIFVGIELETSFVLVEASSFLKDELVAFQGLDTTDLTNFYLVADYISCLKKFHWLESVLPSIK